MVAFLFVAPYEDEWKEEQHLLKEGFPITYGWSFEGEFGEMGSIFVKSQMAV